MSKLTTNTTDLQAILDKVNALPDAGSGGGASVETCSVRVSPDTDATVNMIAYTYVEDDGKVTTMYNDYGKGISNEDIVLSNVVCGSFIYMLAGGISMSISVEGMEALGNDSTSYKAPTTAGATGIINIVGDE